MSVNVRNKGNGLRVLVTGATGFIGSALINCLNEDGKHRPCAAVRRDALNLPVDVERVSIVGLGPDSEWCNVLKGVDVVVHTAAHVHAMLDTGSDNMDEYHRVNVAGTLKLARQAAFYGVGRFVFLSSIKVNGESTLAGSPFNEDDQPAPQDAYAQSKLEAERGLIEIAKQTEMDVVIIRPVLVYGPGVKANFLNLMQWLYRRFPLPLGSINNQRSLVALDNLVDLIVICIDHSAAANQTFLASDGEDLSTTELLQRLSKALGKSVWLLPIPACVIVAAAALVGRRAIAQRLCGSLQVNSSKACTLLDWKPPVSVDEELRKTARHFLDGLK